MDYKINEDLRSIKTEKALFAAMSALLKKQSFKKITVKGICEEALVSRAAFYTHFIDKYDFLKYWITKIFMQLFEHNNVYEQMEKTVNTFVNENTKILRNLVYGADNEIYEILFNILLYVKNMNAEKNLRGEEYQKRVVSANFYAGGILSYLWWQVKNKFPTEVPLMNKIFYNFIEEFKDR